MIELPTPETDALFCRNGYPIEVDSSKAMQLCEKLEQERDWITEKFELLEGCFKRAERERDEAREDLEFRRGLYKVQEEFLEKNKKELTEARKKLDEEIKWHHQTHKELVETQCELLDIEYDKLKS